MPKKASVDDPKPQPKPQPKAEDIVSLRAGVNKFIRRYMAIGKELDSFMVDFKRYMFDTAQVDNARAAMQGKLKEAEINLGRVEQEAQTRLESVELGHRALVEKLTAEKVELQKKVAEVDKKAAELDRMKNDYAALCAKAKRKVEGLAEIAA